MRNYRELITAILLATFTFSSGASAAEGANTDVLKSRLQERFPDVKIEHISAAPLPGLYEIVAGDRIVYSDPAGDFLLMGPLLDTKTKRNLTDDRLGEMQSIDFEALPFTLALKVVKGDGRRRLVVFADPDCPYCQQLEKSLETVTDVTVYTFLYPLESIHPGATERARQIWCADDGAQAWTDWMLRDAMVTKRECSGDPVAALQKLGQSLKINSTPTLFTSDGRRIPGAVSKDEIEDLLNRAAKPAQPQ